MKILLNTTPLNSGGALQVATSFIREVLRDPQGIDWRFATSRIVHEQMRRFHPAPIPHEEVFEDSPATSSQVRRALMAHEARVRPDLVFTICGPAYVQFAAPHLLGAGNPWVAHADIHAYRVLSFPREWITTFLRAIYRAYWYRRCDMLVVQTEYVRQGYHRRVGLPLDRIAVVSNTCGKHYLDKGGLRPFPARGSRVRILCFSAPYKHKRIEIIAQVAKELEARRPQIDFEFVTTLKDDEPLLAELNRRAKALAVESRINNIGPVAVADGPELYRTCDICFLPTVLECFSATYPEAMAMGLPIVTSNLGFLRDVCREAALYFPPDDAAAAAVRIVELVDDEALWNRQVLAGKHVLSTLPDSSSKYLEFVEVLRTLYRRTHGQPPAAPGGRPRLHRATAEHGAAPERA
ncbi:MAG: glycosyltransferase family 4 protein [Planctomycetia bacterium]|nr:glycosyltransferase family 4 protein [Planctomycetia bacterium]